MSDVGKEVTLSSWSQISRNFGVLTFINLSDRYEIIHLVFNIDEDAEVAENADKVNREYSPQVSASDSGIHQIKKLLGSC